MTDPNYTPLAWVDDTAPAISASNLNHLEGGVEDAHERITAIGSGKLALKTLVQFAALTPADGDEYALQVDATLGIIWHVKYRAASASAYKWEVLGMVPLHSQVDTTESTASTTYVALATAGPSIVLPRPGDYVIDVGCTGGVANNAAFMSYDIGGTGAVDADAITTGRPSDAGPMTRSMFKAGLSNVTLTAKYKIAAAVSQSFGYRWMRATPRRIS